jgi:CHAD domain-containing protein
MRLIAKRLRYAIELFSPCWMESLAPFARSIAKLQTSLGELHDCDMWIADLGSMLPEGGKTSSGLDLETRNGALWMLDHFVRERTGHFHSALMRWHEWERSGFLSVLSDVIDDKRPAQSADWPEDQDDQSNFSPQQSQVQGK